MKQAIFQELQLQDLLKVDFTPIVKNFKTLDAMLKSLPALNRKIGDLQKTTKATSQDLSNFKTSTNSQFITLQQMVDSRNNVGKNGTKAIQQQLVEVKKQIKQLKFFVTQSTREVNQNLQQKQKQAKTIQIKNQNLFQQLQNAISSQKIRSQSIQSEVQNVRMRYTQKTQFQIIKSSISQSKQTIRTIKQNMDSTQLFLQNLGVKQFKQILDNMKITLQNQIADMKIKLKLKADLSDAVKLQQMMLQTITNTYQDIVQRCSNKNQTKKALMFLQRKINGIIQVFAGQQQGDSNALAITKPAKCLSCSKDLGQQGKTYKPWQGFPAKDPSKQKYSGFGVGFQTVVQTALAKKGSQISLDQKGKMAQPFNMTRQGFSKTNSLLKQNSQNKLQKGSPVKQKQTNYMGLFGRNNQLQLDIKTQYYQTQRGLMSFIKPVQLQKKQIKLT